MGVMERKFEDDCFSYPVSAADGIKPPEENNIKILTS